MALQKKLKKFLDKHNINYDLLEHKTVYTAFDAAQTLRRRLSEIAKTLVMKADKKYLLIVLPASHRADISKLKKLLKTKDLQIVKETEMAKALKIKPGAVTPFGKFHNVPVYIDKSLLKSKLIIASTGSFTESILMKTKDLMETGAEVLEGFAKEYKYKLGAGKSVSKKGKKKGRVSKQKKTSAKKSVAKTSKRKKAAKKRKNKRDK